MPPWGKTKKATRMLYWNKLQAPVTRNGSMYGSTVAHPNSYAKLTKAARLGHWFAKATGRGINYSKLRNAIPGPTRYSPHARRNVQIGPNVPKTLLVQRPSLKRMQLNGIAMNFKREFPFGRTPSGRAVVPDPGRAIVKKANFAAFRMKDGGRMGGARRLNNRRSPSLGRGVQVNNTRSRSASTPPSPRTPSLMSLFQRRR